jgi:hypothetical protein
MRKTISNLVLALVATGSVSAAAITWDAPIVNTTAADISTDGTLHIASNSAGPTDQTINGVTFSAQSGGPLGSNASGTFYTTGGGVNTTGDIALDTLLDSHSYQGGGGANFDIVGLTIGQTYQIQLLAVGDTRGCCSTRTQRFSGDGVVFSDFITRSDPSSVIGTFVADAATQNIIVDGTTDPGISGFQVRSVNLVGTPFVITSIDFNGNDTITLTWNSRENKTYSVFTSTDLQDFSEDVNDSVASGGDTTSLTFTLSEPLDVRRFFRVVEQ